jgi:hypothetical protein
MLGASRIVMIANTSTLRPVMNQLRAWLSEQNAPHYLHDKNDATGFARKPYRKRLAIACAVIFLIATGVRCLHWQDSHLESGQESLTHRYLQQAEQMLDGDGILFPRDYNDPVNVQLLVHPPGYSMFAAAIFGIVGNSAGALTVAQIVADSAAVMMVVLITAELLPFAVAIMAGLLVAFSPHLSRYSLFLLPESLAALPILVAIYCLILSVKRPRLATLIAAGAFIGLSCWLRANAQLLVVFVAVAGIFLFERGRRSRYMAAMVVATILTISPIAIRNAVVFHHFIPLSIGEGITLIEGIGIFDVENRFGMPKTDHEAKIKDAEWHNRPDYLEGRWKPDGIERDKYRFRRGLEVIGSNPGWFAAVMIRRAGIMLSYNSSVSKGFPYDTAHVQIVATEPSFGHQLILPAGTVPSWAGTAEELIASGRLVSPQAEARLSADKQLLEVDGDASEFGDQFISAPIPVEKNTDYILRLAARVARGQAAAKVTSPDRRISLESLFIVEPHQKKKNKVDDDDYDDSSSAGDGDSRQVNGDAEPLTPVFDMPFATGDRQELLLVISNNGASPDRPTVLIEKAELYRVGTTPQVWTRVVRPAVRGIQRNLYTTSRMLPLVVSGIVLLTLAGRKRALLMLLVVPAYYLVVQSVFHTEYRYILAIHYFLFIMAGVALYCAGRLISRGATWGKRVITQR